ncbi:tetratricopeptide repeat protein [Ohtaekwangia koreensis]|uniref:Tetratricopeptide repeat-containing protein n=1 Tax=Ohtaekwangia koreensis TaxID=688867 RepID=A0A1T5MLZ5_9BACT|nr:hypothetical protein [Ohtaekwangia koreensis]SKC89024.1 hypothetical protein SAMN05660236_5749 [Ohtaekwangia koreensis]
MQSLFFWKNWLKDYRWIGYATAAVFFLSLFFLWFSYFQGVDGVIHWDTIQEQRTVETTVHNFRLGPFVLNIPAESYTILEYFNGSSVEPNTTASYIFLFVLIASAIILLTVITTIERFWYFFGMALFILFVVSLRLEVLGIFGQFNRIPVVMALVLYIVPAFYFNRFKTSVSFMKRLLLFASITLLLALTVAFFSEVEYPLYHLTLTGYTPGLIISVLFIIMIAHEVLAAFINVISQGSSKSLRHLSIISVIYMANVVITALHEMDVIRWNFIYINLYLLLTISAILGIWGYRGREAIYGNVLSFYPFGAYFYLAMGAICFATTGQLLGNANDPALKIIRDVIIFSHAGFGIIFLTYVFSNYIVMLAQNMPIYKILYKPNRMPYFTYRFAGLIAMLAFIFVSDWKGYVYNGMAGFYNSAGDLYALQGNEVYTESFYDQGRAQGAGNHRSNYALGVIKGMRFNFEGAQENYNAANFKRASEYSLANAGNILIWQNEVFDAIEQYHNGIRIMPESGTIANNLGLAYAKVHNLDSALVYFSKAREHDVSKDAAETNFFAMATGELLPLQADSILGVFNTNSSATMANALALSSLYGQPLTVKNDPLAVRILDLKSATLMNNYIIKNAKTLDTAFTKRAYTIASDTMNVDYSISLKSALAYAFYHQGNVAKALEIMAEQLYLGQANQGKYNYIMGLWALEQANPAVAADYFSYADTYDYKDARFYHAIALTEASRIPDALVAWDTVAAGKDEAQQKIATRIRKILTLSTQEAISLTDAEKYQFCRYRISLRDSIVFDRLVNTFQNANYKAQALLDISNKYYRAEQYVPAIRFFNRIAGLELTDKTLYENVQHFELRMLASRLELRSLATQINKGVEFNGSRTLEKILYTALINASNGDTLNAGKNFEIVSRYNPYFEEGILAAADFFREKDAKSMKPYTILSEAIQVNGNSYRLLKAYAEEAIRQGFDLYAASARQRLQELERGF